MVLALALHAAVAGFMALAFGAVAFDLLRRSRHSVAYLSWWLGGALSQLAVALGLGLATFGATPPALDAALFLVFLSAGSLAAVGILTHMIHVFTGQQQGTVTVLLAGATLATLASALAFAPGALTGNLAATVPAQAPPDIILSRALLGSALIQQGLPLAAAFGFAGIAFGPLDARTRERVIFLAGALATWAAAGFLTTLTTLLVLPLAHAAALALTIVGAALCAVCYKPPPWLARRVPALAS